MASTQHRTRRSATLACAAAAALLCAAAPAWAQGTGNGLVGDYYNHGANAPFSTPIIETRTNEPAFPIGTPLPDFNVNWVGANPGGILVNADNFSIRYRGQIEAPSSETYTFFTSVDDQARLYINGQQIIALGGSGNGTFPMTINTKYDFVLEYVENGGNASIRLEWQSPIVTPRASVPRTRFYSPTPVPATPTITPNTTSITPQLVTLASTTVTAGTQIWYTLDDSDPGITGPDNFNASAILYTAPFNVTTFCKVRARTYLNGLSSDQLVSANFTPSLLPVAPAAPGGSTPSLLYCREFVTNNTGVIPNFGTLVPRARFTVAQVSATVPPMPARATNTNFGYTFQGYITVPSDAGDPTNTWTFFLNADDGAKLLIDGMPIVSNDGFKLTAPIELSGQVSLTPGLHTFDVLYTNGQGTPILGVSWQSFSNAKVPIPAAAFSTQTLTAAPTLVPAVNTNFNPTLNVTFNGVGTIYYTLDGTFPDPLNANGIANPGDSIVISASSTVRAIAIENNKLASPVVTVVHSRTANPGPTVQSAVAAAVPTEVIVSFDKPLLETSVASGAFTLDNGATVSNAVVLQRPGALVARWTMDGAAGNADPVGGFVATITGTPTAGATVPIAGYVNPTNGNSGSLHFDGTSTTFTVPHNAALNTGMGSFTVAGWMRTTNRAVNQTVISKFDPAAAAGAGVGWLVNLTPTGNLAVQIRDGTAGRNFSNNSGGIVAANDTWYHMAIRFDKLTNRVTYFRNGVSITTQDVNNDMENLDNGAAIVIGAGTNGFFTGDMDDWRLYKVSLSTAEVAALALGSDRISSTVKLTTSVLTPVTAYTLSIGTAIQDFAGAAAVAGMTTPFRYFIAGTVTHERYTGINNGQVTDLARNANFPNSPNFGSSLAILEVNPNQDNYGARVRGYLFPPGSATSDFQFAIAGDDSCKFFLSTDEDPANKVLIAYGNQWVGARNFTTAGGGALPVQSGPITLTGGKKYYFEAFVKEATGGDNLAVAVRALPAGPAIVSGAVPIGDPASAFTIANIAPYIDPLIITTQPVSKTVQAGQTVTLTVAAVGTLADAAIPRFQWQKFNPTAGPPAFQNVGVTTATLTLTGIVPSQAGQYRCIVSNGTCSVISAVAVVTVVDGLGMTVAPSSGPIAGGTPITIAGAGFQVNATSVTFGGTAATNVVVTNSNSLTCTAPAHVSGTVAVIVSTYSIQQTSGAGYTYLGVPTATGTTPPDGPVGSQTITIDGTNFSPVVAQNIVTVNGTTVGVTVNNATPTSINVTIPASPNGAIASTVPIGVSHAGGGPATTSFTYYPVPVISLTPPSGTTASRVVTINGNFFSTIAGRTTVSWNSANLAITNITTNSITVTIPISPNAGAITAVPVQVTTAGIPSNIVNYTYYPAPTVGGMDISEGSTAGGYSAVISGTNFSTVTTENSVTFGATGATVTNATPTTLTVTVPALVPPGTLPTGVTVSVTAPGTTGAPGTVPFTYYPTPTITTVSPNFGKAGDLITISGNAFSPTAGKTVITINGNPAAIQTINTTTITALVPGRTPAAVAITTDVLSLTSTGPGSATNSFTYYPTPAFTNSSSSGGSAQGGDLITITGNFFLNGSTSVTFGGIAGIINSVTVNQIQVFTPGTDASAVPVPVVITAPGGTVSAGTYLYSGPRVATIAPSSGPAAGGGAPIIITGSGFVAGTTSVTIGGTLMTGLTVTPTQISFSNPAHAATPVPVDVVVTVTGNTPVTLPGAFSWIASSTVTGIALGRGPMNGGQTVQITGTNFSGADTTVTFGGIAATNIVVAGNGLSLTCTTPLHVASATPVPVAVQVAVFGINSTGTLNYTYVPPPTITGIAPNRGPVAGGRTVTLTGTFFEPDPQTHVQFAGGLNIQAFYVNATTATVVTPPHAFGPVAVTVSTFTPDQATAGNSVTYTYVDPATSVDLSVTNVPSTATPGLNTNVTFTVGINNLAGGAGATSVFVHSPFPAGLSFVSATPSTGTFDGASGLWNLGSLASGASASVQIVAKVTSASPIVFTAEVFGCAQADLDSTPDNGVVEEDDLASASVSAGLVLQTAAGSLGTTSPGLYFSRQIVATGGYPAYAWSIAANPDLPPLNFDTATGVLSGFVPPAATLQTYSFTVTVTDSSAATLSALYTLNVVASSAVAPMIVATPAPPGGVVGKAYQFGFSAHTGNGPVMWTSTGSLPTGLSLNSVTGLLAGTPTTTTGSPFTFTIVATGASGVGNQGFTIAIAANPIVITTTTLPNGSLGALYEQVIQAEGGVGPTFNWTVTTGNASLPDQVFLTQSGRTASLIGSPSSAITYNFTLQVQDGASGPVDTQSYTVTINGPGTTFVATTPATPPTGTLNLPFSLPLTAAGGTQPYSWSVVGGALPAGVILDTAANPVAISGTPTAAGVFTVIVRGASSGGQSGTQTITITIAPLPVILTPDPLPAAQNGLAYFKQLQATGGAPPLTWSFTGTLPTGLSLNPNSGAISGVPTAAGAGLNITVTDANGVSDSQAYTFSFLNGGALGMLGSLPAARPGVPYSAQLSANGGTPPYTFSLVGTAPGLTVSSINATTCILSGTPLAGFIAPVQVQLMDTGGPPATVLSNLLVMTDPLDITQSSIASGTVGAFYSVPLTIVGAQGTVVWTVTSGTLPPGLTLNATGTISGTLTTAGTSTFQVQAVDGIGQTTQQQFTVTVAAGGGGGGGSSGGGGGGGCGLLGVEAVLLYLLRRRRRNS